jgi:solute:Na+ symporter, SSS family
LRRLLILTQINAGPFESSKFDQTATIPAVIVGLYTRWFNPWALILGWAAGLISGTWMAASLSFQSAVFPLAVDGFTVPGYAALYALGINFAVSIVLSLLLNPVRVTRGTDQTLAADYRF